jgi:hypothetical protein
VVVLAVAAITIRVARPAVEASAPT